MEAIGKQCRKMVFVRVSFFFSLGTCAECGKGAIYEGMGVVELQAGYFARWDSAGFVQRCFGVDSSRCPGGPPGTCARNRVNTSVACGTCEPGTREMTDGPCEVCSASDVCPSLQRGLFRLLRSAHRKQHPAKRLFGVPRHLVRRCSLSSRCLRPHLGFMARTVRHDCQQRLALEFQAGDLERRLRRASDKSGTVHVDGFWFLHGGHGDDLGSFHARPSRPRLPWHKLKSKSALIGGLGPSSWESSSRSPPPSSHLSTVFNIRTCRRCGRTSRSSVGISTNTGTRSSVRQL